MWQVLSCKKERCWENQGGRDASMENGEENNSKGHLQETEATLQPTA